MKDDKPYGGGAFRLHGKEAMTLKLADPEVRFRVIGLEKGYDEAQAIPEEPWMDDTSELLNRSTVSFLRGTLDGRMTRSFQHLAQGAAWWYSKNWGTVYVATDWMDYKTADPRTGLAPHIATLWRSMDGGKTWAELKWPEDRNISELQFLDPQRGYAIGWGPHVWRTADGGQSWHEIKVPPLADVGRPRKTFDAVNLGPDGVLRVAYHVDQLGDIKASSLVYRIAWSQPDFEPDVVLPNQTVVDLQSTPSATPAYSLYVLSRLGKPRNWDEPSDNGRRTGAISVWESVQRPNVKQLHTFDERLLLDGLSVGKQGVLLAYATDVSGDGAPRDPTFLSKDFGKSWDVLNDGYAQGGYFDPDTNTQYALFAYTLKKRRF